ncbi:hypothetical protein CcaverHIS641_0704210 [Cutaneotrichosporon cavernicola]|nr:hypothetical protein CcaverHIS641_0704210 [Cutaneotrichosporon cavernicola]
MTDKPVENMVEKTAQNINEMDPPALMVRNPDPTPPATPAIREDEPELASLTRPTPTSTFHPAAHFPDAATPTSPTATLSHVPTLPPPTHPGRRSPRPPASPEHPRRLPPPVDTSKPVLDVSSPHSRFLAPEPTIQPASSPPTLPLPGHPPTPGRRQLHPIPITTKPTTQPAQAAEEAAAAIADSTSLTEASATVVGSKEAEATLDSAAQPGSELPAYTHIDEGVAEPSAVHDKAAPPALPARHPAPHQSTLPIPLPHDEDPSSPESAEPTQATVKLNEMVLIYPPTLQMTEDELKTEFVNSLLRTKSKAQRDTIIATGLLPVTLAIDWALIFVGWVFGGALEVDAVWLASSFRGAKTARSVTKRLTSSDADLKLTFKPSHRADLLQAYLAQRCSEADPNRFEAVKMAPSSYQVLDSIGWEAAGKYDAHNWEEERWERQQVETDLKTTMGKAAGAWRKWCDRYEKDPEKAVKR